jgi:hypothetical protein
MPYLQYYKSESDSVSNLQSPYTKFEPPLYDPKDKNVVLEDLLQSL